MNERPNLPIYAKPPVDEVAIGVQFPSIPDFLDTHAGLYWQKVREDYPRVQVQPRLDIPIESSEPPQPVQLQIPLGNVSQNRTWLISPNDDYVIQIQNTRFISNWRRREAPYPRFERLAELFVRHLDQFLRLLEDEQLEKPRLQQIEVSYINWVPELPMHAFLKVAGPTAISTPSGVKPPEDQNWSARYLLEDEPQVIKRLYVQSNPAIRSETPDVQGSQLAFSFRAARTSGFTQDEVVSLMREGRIVAVQAFTELTTPEAHKTWERTR